MCVDNGKRGQRLRRSASGLQMILKGPTQRTVTHVGMLLSGRGEVAR